MLMMTSQILKSVDFTKTQISQYLKNEALFFLQVKKFINYTSGLLYDKEKFCSRGNLSSLVFNYKPTPI